MSNIWSSYSSTSILTPPPVDPRQARIDAVSNALASIDQPVLREISATESLLALLLGCATLTTALAKAQSIDDVRAAAAPFAEETAALLEALASGDLKLPYVEEGAGTADVFASLIRLSNGATAALAAGRKRQAEAEKENADAETTV